MTLLRVLVATIILLSFIGCSNNSGFKKPNVILIMTDDQGYGDLACHGNPIIETPNLDKLHSESVRFTNFHVNPFCAPTRAALMTGRFSDLTHVRTTINGRNHLNVTETTMAEYFKASGYTTGLFGKWHLGQNYPFRPIDRGFDQWVGHGDGGTGTASDYWGNDKMNDTYMRNGVWEKFKGFCTDIYFDEAMHFIDNNNDAPFFVYLATNVPHGPFNVMKEWTEKYKDKLDASQQWTIDFYATISHFDENLGRLRTYLDERNLTDNTILIFLTDNGTSGGSGVCNGNMRGVKGSVYEGGHRVPCFIYWPGSNLCKAIDIDQLTSHIDILPTLIDLCDLKTPEKALHQLSGHSWQPLLEHDEENWEAHTLFLHSQNATQQHEKWKNSVVATEQWRLVNKNELYNITSDPEQKIDVAHDNPIIVSQLTQDYEEYWHAIGEGKSKHQRVILGSGQLTETWLTCDAWIPKNSNPHTWDQKHVNSGVENFGFWPITVVKQDTYKFDVRRWPKEINCPISDAPITASHADVYRAGKPVVMEQGKVIAATKVRLAIGNKHYEKNIKSTDTAATFQVEVERGDTEVQAWLIDAQGNEYPAYYIYVNG